MGSLDQGLRCELFGAVRVWRGDAEVDLGPLRQRVVLAALLAAGGEPVSMGTLVDLVWETDPPASAVNMLHRHVGELRRILEPSMLTRATGRWLLPAGDGYRLIADSDLLAFRRKQKQARDLAAAGQQAEALAGYTEALAIARGPAAGDLGSQAGQHTAFTAIDRERADAAVAAADCALAADAVDDGAVRDLLQALRSVAVADSLNEQLYARLVLLLHQAGNSAAALTVFGEIRERLADELGISPGPELGAAHQRVLQGSGDHQSAPGVIPAQLPAGTALFAGRRAELAEATALALDGQAAATVLITAIGGLAGIGKTTFAVHWARDIADRYPGGQLYVNLRGFDLGERVLPPAEALEGFLRALRVDPGQIPDGLDARAALYRSILAGRRMLVLLDNARDSEQVRPLLPGAPGCLVIVTSRDRLAGLVATDGARPLRLGLLSGAEAHELLSRHLGDARLAADPPSAEAIIAACGGLSLALAIVAARLVTSPGLTLAAVAAELAGRAARLDVLDVGDIRGNLRAVFSWSYNVLSAAGARMFRLLGAHPGPDISIPAAASLAGISLTRAVAQLAELTATSMITESAPGRYAFHDLLRVYAADRLNAGDPQEREEAQARLIDHYMHSAQGAYRRYATPPFAVPDPDRPGVVPEGHADAESAMHWYVSERPVLLAVFDLAVATGANREACLLMLGWRPADHLETTIGHMPSYATTAARIAESLGSPDLAAEIQCDLGVRYQTMGRSDLADQHYRLALGDYMRLGNLVGVSRTRGLISAMYSMAGRHDEAVREAELSVQAASESGDAFTSARAYAAVSAVYWATGDLELGLGPGALAVEMYRELGNPLNLISALSNMGGANMDLRRHDVAIKYFEECLDVLAGMDATGAERDGWRAMILPMLGDVLLASGDEDAARAAWTQDLAVLARMSSHAGAQQLSGTPTESEIRERLSALP